MIDPGRFGELSLSEIDWWVARGLAAGALKRA